jgi:hypothetical protein
MTAAHGTLRTRLSFRFILAAAAALLPLATMNDALACASCGDTLSRDWGSQGVSTMAGFSADLSYTYIDQNTMLYGSSKPSAALVNTLYANGQEIETDTRTQFVIATLNYNSDTWGVSLQIPYLFRNHSTDGQLDPLTDTPATVPRGTNGATSADNGIGDMRIIGRYNGLSADGATGVIAGIKLPTGSTNAVFTGGPAAGAPLDASLQLGTGSTDIILGGYTSGLVSKYGWFVQATVQHAVSGLVDEGPGGTYRPGDAHALNAGIRYAGFGAKVSPMLQLNIIHRNSDEGTGVFTDVLTGASISGGTLAYLAPGATVRVGGGTSVYGFVQLPVYQNVSSLQLVPQYTLTLGLYQTF